MKVRERTAAERAHGEWLDARELVTRCAACRWTHRGTAADGRRAAREHREARHPELARSGRTRLNNAQQRERAMLASEWRRKRIEGEE